MMKIWCRFEPQETRCALSRALDNAGNSIEIRTAMMPMTTSSSTSVNALRDFRGRHIFFLRMIVGTLRNGWIQLRAGVEVIPELLLDARAALVAGGGGIERTIVPDRLDLGVDHIAADPP